MKNLKLLYNKNHNLNLKNIKSIALNTTKTGIVYICTDTELFSFDWAEKVVKQIAEIQNVIAIEYLSLTNELCAATVSGDVDVYALDTLARESVTYCDGGIEAMSWSPDQEVIAFVTRTNLVVVMNSAYDPLSEHNLNDEDFGEEKFINVGWGKKETQFHGTEGKEAAKKIEEISEPANLSQLDKSVSIVWRGDGEYFAISFVGKWGRMFKVYDKEGKLKYTSEKCTGLEAPIFWRPSGSWLAIPQTLPNKYTIALFEKNGLRHREIVLPFQNEEEKVIRLLWNSESDVLAVETTKDNKSNVYLYTICNYHWYFKQSLSFNDRLQMLIWDSNYLEGKSLHLVQVDGTYSVYRWEHTVDHSTGETSSDQSVVGVIDRTNILLTGFRGAVVPPPMCSFPLNHTVAINNIGFLRRSQDSNWTNRFFIVDASNNIGIYDCEFERNESRGINLLNGCRLVKQYSWPLETNIPLLYHHWLWLNTQNLIVCYHKDASTVIALCELFPDDSQLKIVDEVTVDGIVGSVSSYGPTDSVVYHLTSGELYLITVQSEKLSEPQNLYNLNCFCEKIDSGCSNNDTKIIALRGQQHLYINEKKLSENVTSFYVTERFVLFTTLDRLKFIHLDNEQIINERRIERGGKLVICVPKESRTVLQMPRGNLETIQPRVLSLCITAELLDAGEYKKTFDLLRKQRINLNLLVDHSPVKFLENLAHFVDNIENTQWLNLFLSDLQNEDVTVSMYSSNYPQARTTFSECFGNNNKIDIICERIEQVFHEKGLDKFLLPAITTCVKRKDLEAALVIIWSVRKQELNSVTNGVNSPNAPVSSQEALKYLLYLVNVNDLYDVALGMYEFDLVLFVAQKSQKDPKEYIPFLNELKGFEENYRKFRIDNYLKRYEKALTHIVKCGVEKLDECLELIDKHNLYTQALRVFDKSHECYREVVLQYADHLRSKGVFYDACLMYERGGDFKQALLTAKHTLDWRKCLWLARRCSYSPEDIQQLCSSLIPALQEIGKYKDAAELVKQHCDDKQLFIRLLCDGRHYHQAIYEARDIYPAAIEFIINHVSDYSNALLTKIQAHTNQFQSYTQRLLKIRKEKQEKLLNGVDDDVDECDLYSDTSSMNSSRFTGTSKGSGRSHRSSKNRRKHERKLLSLKEGNPFEDIALIDVLYDLVYKSFDQQQSISDMLKVLIDVELDEKGVEVQREYGNQLRIIKDSLDLIWLPEMMVSGEIKMDEFLNYAKVQDEQHYAMIKPHQRARPFLKTFDWQLEMLKS